MLPLPPRHAHAFHTSHVTDITTVMALAMLPRCLLRHATLMPHIHTLLLLRQRHIAILICHAAVTYAMLAYALLRARRFAFIIADAFRYAFAPGC